MVRKHSGEPGRKVVTGPQDAEGRFYKSTLSDDQVGPLQTALAPGFWAPGKRLPEVQDYMIELALDALREHASEIVEHSIACEVLADFFSDSELVPTSEPHVKHVFLSRFSEKLVNHLRDSGMLEIVGVDPVVYAFVTDSQATASQEIFLEELAVSFDDQITIREFFEGKVVPAFRQFRERLNQAERRAVTAESAASKEQEARLATEKALREAEGRLAKMQTRVAEFNRDIQDM